jgi:hypothetical protein
MAMSINATFNNILVRVCQLFWWEKPEYPEKTTNLPQVTFCAILNKDLG